MLEMQNRKYTNEITADDDGEQVSIAGWVHVIRSLALKAIRDFLDARRFIELNTPKIVRPRQKAVPPYSQYRISSEKRS